MALAKCPKCSKEVSSKTEKCLNCGYKIKIKKENNKYINFICNNYCFFHSYFGFGNNYFSCKCG